MILSTKELRSNLEKKFDIEIFFDIGEISQKPNRLLQILDPIYKPVYQANERIVAFTSREISIDLWKHLYETMNFLDISNWFVLICGPEFLRNSLIDSHRKFSKDPIPFQFVPTNLEPTQVMQEGYLFPDTMCAIPWTNLEIRANGDITPCCASESISLGNIQKNSLEEAFFSDKMEDLRQRLYQGLQPSECKSCWKVEEQGLTSIRMHNIKRLKKNLLLNYLENPTLSTLDIKFNNTCNFKCRICSSENSSLFAQEQHRHLKVPLVTNAKWEDSQIFLDQVIEHLPKIKNIDMYGGEPFLIKRFSRVLEIAVKKEYASNIRLHYNSNGSIWPAEFIEFWPYFQEVDIHFSIDNVGSRFELERGGSWKAVEQNIVNLQKLNMANLKMKIMPAIGVMNVYYLDELYRWANDHGLDIFVSYVKSKNGLGLDSLTESAKKILFDKYQNHPWAEIQNILKMIDRIPNSDGRLFCDTMAWFDRVRKQNFYESHPEVALAMGYVYNSAT